MQVTDLSLSIAQGQNQNHPLCQHLDMGDPADLEAQPLEECLGPQPTSGLRHGAAEPGSGTFCQAPPSHNTHSRLEGTDFIILALEH